MPGKEKIGFLAVIPYLRYIGSSVLIVSLSFFFLHFSMSKERMSAWQISRNTMRIARAIEQINRDCEITSIDARRSPEITFLTKISLPGSSGKIGPLTVKNPENWNGPYLKEDPVLNGKIYYKIADMKEGFFIVPGNGALLPNGLEVGRDFLLKSNLSITDEISRYGNLNFLGEPLASPVFVKIGERAPIRSVSKPLRGLIDKLRRLGEIVPYAKNFYFNKTVLDS